MPAEKKSLAKGAKYSKADILGLFQLFTELDKSKNGHIDTKDFAEMLPELHKSKVKLSHVEFIRSLDMNRDGVVTFKEMLHKLYPHATAAEHETMYKWAYPDAPVKLESTLFEPTPEQLEDIKAMFKIYDTNSNSGLDFKELSAMAAKTGYDAKEIEELFRCADKNQDQIIDFEEFVQMMRTAYI